MTLSNQVMRLGHSIVFRGLVAGVVDVVVDVKGSWKDLEGIRDNSEKMMNMLLISSRQPKRDLFSAYLRSPPTIAGKYFPSKSGGTGPTSMQVLNK